MEEIQAFPDQVKKQLPIEVLFFTARDQLIDNFLMRETANTQKEKLLKNPEVQAAIDNAINQVILRAYRNNIIEDKVRPNHVRERYQALVKEFPKGTHETKLRVILVKTEKDAKEIEQALKEGIDFLKMAREKSIDKGTSQKDGDLGYINVLQKAELPKEFHVVFEKDSKGEYIIKTGKYTEKPIEIRANNTVVGYIFLKIDDRKPFEAPKFNAVKGGIRNELNSEAISKHLETLKKSHKITRSHPNTGKPMKSLDEELKSLQEEIKLRAKDKSTKKSETSKK